MPIVVPLASIVAIAAPVMLAIVPVTPSVVVWRRIHTPSILPSHIVISTISGPAATATASMTSSAPTVSSSTSAIHSPPAVIISIHSPGTISHLLHEIVISHATASYFLLPIHVSLAVTGIVIPLYGRTATVRQRIIHRNILSGTPMSHLVPGMMFPPSATAFAATDVALRISTSGMKRLVVVLTHLLRIHLGREVIWNKLRLGPVSRAVGMTFLVGFFLHEETASMVSPRSTTISPPATVISP
mmetsp:Transcript_30988/g.75568  ORF Transcript_30988/g.75568 Transcript_30988/m.75568 type:complete len:244 (+) Transcript_30988:1508-2239(+)